MRRHRSEPVPPPSLKRPSPHPSGPPLWDQLNQGQRQQLARRLDLRNPPCPSRNGGAGATPKSERPGTSGIHKFRDFNYGKGQWMAFRLSRGGWGSSREKSRIRPCLTFRIPLLPPWPSWAFPHRQWRWRSVGLPGPVYLRGSYRRNRETLSVIIIYLNIIMTQEIEHLTGMIDEDPSDAWLYCERGWAYYKAGRMSLAIRDFDQAIALDDREPEFRVGRGSAYQRMGYIEPPREDFDRAIELDPNDARAYSCRAEYRSWMHEHEAAVADFDRVISLEPLDPFSRCNRGLELGRAGGLGRALEDFDEAIRLDPEEALFYYRRAEAILYHNPNVRPEDALPDLEEAIRLNPAAEWYREERGYIRFYEGRWGDAAGDFACQDISHRLPVLPLPGGRLGNVGLSRQAVSA